MDNTENYVRGAQISSSSETGCLVVMVHRSFRVARRCCYCRFSVAIKRWHFSFISNVGGSPQQTQHAPQASGRREGALRQKCPRPDARPRQHRGQVRGRVRCVGVRFPVVLLDAAAAAACQASSCQRGLLGSRISCCPVPRYKLTLTSPALSHLESHSPLPPFSPYLLDCFRVLLSLNIYFRL